MDSPTSTLERLHIDHAQWGKHLLLILVYAFAKWLEVHLVSSSSASQMIDKLRTIFAMCGVTVTLVSDNGPPFTSAQIEAFMKANGIVHKQVPKITSNIFIFDTPLSCVGNRMKIVAEKGVGEHKPRLFKEGQSVALCDFHPYATTKWHKALVKKQLGSLTYEVEVYGQLHSAHVDHLKPWPVESLPRSKPPFDDIPLDLLSQTPPSDNNDNSRTALFLIPVTDITNEESEEQPHITNGPQNSRRPPR